MNPAVAAMLARYECTTRGEYENAMKEIIQEIALLGLWRAKFFEHAAFYGGTALRILYGLDRFSEDLDFSLLTPNVGFKLETYLRAIQDELAAMQFNVEVVDKIKTREAAIESAFIKPDTKEVLLMIDVPEQIAERIARNDRMKIKLEIDTDPPGGFETEAKILLQPIAFSVNTYKQPDLFAGKIHAILQRSWDRGRVKGRDYYDFVWYAARNTPVHLNHLEQRLRQSHAWTTEQAMTKSNLDAMLREKFSEVDFELAKKDVLPFIKDTAAVQLWSKEFFDALVPRLSYS
jgi:predicted nucleotidyltransferase component of viral defense system